MEVQVHIREVKFSKPNISNEELKVPKYLRLSKDAKFLQAANANGTSFFINPNRKISCIFCFIPGFTNSCQKILS
jgi:hypothetical protein